MYQLLRSLTAQQFFGQQVPALSGSLILAELFYKFHSFLLESLAFLATWFVLDAVVHAVVTVWRRYRLRSGPVNV